MSGRAAFADLPLELSESIILLAAHTWAVDDKSTVASLSRASRAIHALVRPMLFDTVIVTASNLSRICDAPGTSFRSTRRLVIDKLNKGKIVEFSLVLYYTASFPALEMFWGPSAAISAILRASKPVRVVLTDRIVAVDALLAPDQPGFSNMTHIGATISAFIHPQTLELDLSPLPISHLMLDVKIGSPTHVRAVLVTRIIPKLLTLSKLERLCFRLAPYSETDELRLDLEAYARHVEETRLYVAIEMEGLGRSPSAWDPLTTFEDEHWLVGEPLFTRYKSVQQFFHLDASHMFRGSY